MVTAKQKYLQISTEGKVLIITINNPPHNYLTSGFFIELDSARKEMLSPDIRAIIFIGAGAVFSKGADIGEIRALSSDMEAKTIFFGNELYSFISNLKVPVIAAINGPCFGGGLELALACHLRVCSEKARLGLPEVTLGGIPGLGGIQRLIRVVGEAKALEMILLGDMVSSSKALQLNLVSRIFPKQDFFARTLQFTKTISAAPREAVVEVLKQFALMRSEDEENQIRSAAEGLLKLAAGMKDVLHQPIH